MDEKYLKHLLDRFLAGTATASEKKQLNEWYAERNDQTVTWETESSGEQQALEQRMRANIMSHVRLKQKPVVRLKSRVMVGIAASLTGLLLISGAYYLVTKDKGDAQLRSASIAAPDKYSENKYILLPDSSKVLLHPGSRIQYRFTDKIRELTLVGEGYFDIKHLTAKPFVIHTGKITTTVLGTAFNIKAYAGQQVVVSVTRGKVSVADETQKLIAILTPGQEVDYSLKSKVATHENKVKESITWVKADMQFDGMEYKQLAEKLERRYDVAFSFKNPDMEKCLITGRFQGTESIEEVLRIISETLGSTYKIEGNKVMVDGKGCQQ